MSKWKALILSGICAITAIVGFTQQALMPSLAFTVGFMLFGSIWLYKSQRDFNIVSQGRLEKLETPKTSVIPMTSKGSRRLFVPPPISD